jgi:Bacterial mobilisation protein (MobC)
MPRSKQNEVRENYQLRLSPSERTVMQEKADAANLKLSEYIRVAAINTIIHSPAKIPELNRNMYVELGRIGENINQIAKVLSSIPVEQIVHADLKMWLSELQLLKSQIQHTRLEITAIVKVEN